MARRIDPVCRLCRREGMKLFLKGERCYSPKCAFEKRNYAPGMHGKKGSFKRKESDFATQLREKQRARRIYGVQERQFRRYFRNAQHVKGMTGVTLLLTLERRLDNVVFRMGLATSRAQARQVVRHNFVWVNSKRVNIPSFLIDKDDVVEVKAKEKAKKKILENMELSKDRSVPPWLDFNAQELKSKVARLPEKDDIPANIQEQLIVELYSK